MRHVYSHPCIEAAVRNQPFFYAPAKMGTVLRLSASDGFDGCKTIALPAPGTGLEIAFTLRLNVKNRFQDCFYVPADIEPVF